MTPECDSLGDIIPSAPLKDWLAAGKLHAWSTEGGSTQICMKSLLQCLESEDVPSLPNPNQTIPKTGEGT
jgi:hypothetical protein